MVTSLEAAGLGALLAAGVVGIVMAGVAPGRAASGDDATTKGSASNSSGPPLHASGWVREIVKGGARTRDAVMAVVAGIACAGVTRWPAAAIFGVVVWLALPMCLERGRPGDGARRAEAVAGWTELVRDALSASAGLAQALMTTAGSAPAPIRPEVSAIATRLANGVSLESSLRSFASEVDDAAADFVVCALLLAASSRAQRLTEVLGALVDTIRDNVAMQLRVDASRSTARSSIRTIVLFSIAFVVLLLVVAHAYLAPFGSAQGQLVLTAVGLLYAVGLGLMVRLSRPVHQPRLFDAARLR